jgi:hypothetical protein
LQQVLRAFLITLIFGACAPAKAQLSGGQVAVAAHGDVIAVARNAAERRLLRVLLAPGVPPRFAVFGPPRIAAVAVAPGGGLMAAIRTKVEAEQPDSVLLLDHEGTILGAPAASSVGDLDQIFFSPRGDAVAVVSRQSWVEILTVTGAGAERHLVSRASFAIAPQERAAFAFTPDGAAVGTVSNRLVFTLRDLDGRVLRRLDLARLNPENEVLSGPGDEAPLLRFAPAGGGFAIRSGPGPQFLGLFDRDGREIKPAGGRALMTVGFAYLPGGGRVLRWGGEKPSMLRIGQGLTSTELAFGSEVQPLAVMADGETVAAADAFDRIALWSVEGKRLGEPAALDNWQPVAAQPGAKGEIVVLAQRYGTVDLFTKAGTFVRRIQSGSKEADAGVALSGDGSLVASFNLGTLGVIGADGAARRWSRIWEYYGGQDYFVALAADGSRVVTVGPGTELRSWSADGGPNALPPLRDGGIVPGRVRSLAVSGDGALIAVGDERGSLWLVAPATGALSRLVGATAVTALAFSPDGAMLAVGDKNGMVRLLGRDGRPAAAPFRGAEWGGVARLVFAPEGNKVIVVEEDERAARVLALDGRPLEGPFRTLLGQRIVGGYFSPAGTMLITGYRTDGASGEWMYFLQHIDGTHFLGLAPPRQD